MLTFTGKKFVLYNKVHNCRKSLIDERAVIVTEKCNMKNYIDPNLNSWVILPNIKETEPRVVVTKFHNYIYCYPKNITYHDRSHYCPPTVFKLPTDISFKTGNSEYEAITVSMNITRKDIVIDNLHYDELDTPSVNELHLIENQRNLIDQVERLKDMNNELTISNSNNSPCFWTIISMILNFALISFTCWYLFHKYVKTSSYYIRRARRNEVPPEQTENNSSSPDPNSKAYDLEEFNKKNFKRDSLTTVSPFGGTRLV